MSTASCRGNGRGEGHQLGIIIALKLTIIMNA